MMKNYSKLIAIAVLIAAAPSAQAAYNLNTVNKVVKEVGGPEEAKNMFKQAQSGLKKSTADVRRLSDEIKAIQKECPLSSLDPFGGKFQMSCAQKTAKLAVEEIKLKAAQAKQAWDSELVKKLRALIQKNWPAVKKQLGL